MGVWIVLVPVVLLLVWLLVRPRKPQVPPELLNPNVDINELRRAENELEDLDALARPEDVDDHLPDWGPGAPGN